jgi:hypothetical protein
MRRTLRWVLLAVALAGLVYGLAFERRTVVPITADPAVAVAETVDALTFVEGTTFDAYILRDGKLSDARSLVPAFAQVKDCKT